MGTPAGGTRIALATVKVVASLIGGPIALIGLMSLLGAFLENGWARLGIALVVLIFMPLFVADRLLPDDDPARGRGLPTETLALIWLGLAVLAAGVLAPFGGPLVHREADRLSSYGYETLSSAARFLAGGYEAPASDDDDESSTGASDDEDEDPEASARASGPDGSRAERDGGSAVTDAGPATSAGGELTPAQIFRAWAPSVVSIQLDAGGGTGFVVSADGLVATNHHVIRDSTDVRVKLMDGTFADDVRLVADDEDADLAILRIRVRSLPRPVTLGDSDAVQVGERSVVIGNPLGLEHTLSEGIISARRVFQGRRMIQTTAPVSPGNSGGPIFDARGRVIGITTAIVGAFGLGQNLNLAVPVNELTERLRRASGQGRRIGGGAGEQSGSW